MKKRLLCMMLCLSSIFYTGVQSISYSYAEDMFSDGTEDIENNAENAEVNSSVETVQSNSEIEDQDSFDDVSPDSNTEDEVNATEVNATEVNATEVNATDVIETDNYQSGYLEEVSSFQWENNKNVQNIILSDTYRVERESNIFYLTATITPSDAANQRINWSSSNPSVATVDQDGQVIVWKSGRAVITATAMDGSNVSASCTVVSGYYISYKMNGGKNNSENPTFYEGVRIPLKNPTRKGYVFKGWYENEYYEKFMKSIPSNLVWHICLEAKWEKAKPKKPVIISCKRTGKQSVVKFRVNGKASGYQIVYASDKNFRKNRKVIRTKYKSTVLKKLALDKDYYVKVRGYRKDSTGRIIYGNYSSVKMVGYEGGSSNLQTPVVSVNYNGGYIDGTGDDCIYIKIKQTGNKASYEYIYKNEVVYRGKNLTIDQNGSFRDDVWIFWLENPSVLKIKLIGGKSYSLYKISGPNSLRI